jgi:hypothetical protein
VLDAQQKEADEAATTNTAHCAESNGHNDLPEGWTLHDLEAIASEQETV